MAAALTGFWLGRRRYAAIFELQRSLFELRKAEEVGDLVLCLEHDPVITLGRGARSQDVLEPRSALAARGIDVEVVDRGGEVTLHGPGQLVCYPILRLAPDRHDVRRYVRDLTAVMRSLIDAHGVDSGEVEGLVGLWVDLNWPESFRPDGDDVSLAKIGAIGVRLSRWVTMHGFALNLTTDLSRYRSIVPCGITRHGVCSLESITGHEVSTEGLAGEAWRLLAERLDRSAARYLDLSATPTAQLLGVIRQSWASLPES